MTLEEAKEIMQSWMEYNKKNKNVLREADTTIAVQETILKALEDSIPKEKVREKIEQLTENDNLVINEKWDSVDVVCAKREEMAQVDILQELLGGDYMSHAEVCPVCKGNGKIFDKTIPNCGGTTANIYNLGTCHGCNGKGWVQVEDKE